jgi:surfeit locus 1 family protein
MWRIALRPRWIAALLLSLAIAAGFAALGQWQLSRSIDTSVPAENSTETPVALASATSPGIGVPENLAGQRVTVTGHFVASDFRVLSNRVNLDNNGFWVVGHFVTTDNEAPGLAVALGWAPTADRADAAVATLADAAFTGDVIRVAGRYLPSDSPQQSDFEAGEQSALAVAQLINQWRDVGPAVYTGFVVSDAASVGLDLIDSPPPSSATTVNLLNIFYAVEWIAFAGFAVYLWYRLVKDAWEREEHERAEAARAGADRAADLH